METDGQRGTVSGHKWHSEHTQLRVSTSALHSSPRRLSGPRPLVHARLNSNACPARASPLADVPARVSRPLEGSRSPLSPSSTAPPPAACSQRSSRLTQRNKWPTRLTFGLDS